LDVGRSTRVVAPAQRCSLAVRDGGGRFPSCDRPVAWCDAHHLRHWLHRGPTDLDNLVLRCRGHHHAVHEGGWRLHRHPDDTITATPPTDDNPPPPERRPAGAAVARAGHPHASCSSAAASRNRTAAWGGTVRR
jgi:hypothetical protein